MGASRALGGLLCIACVAIIVAEVYFGLYKTHTGATAPLAISLPVVVGVVVIAGLGFWLGWIMATTKEVTPTPVAPAKSTEAKEPEKEKK